MAMAEKGRLRARPLGAEERRASIVAAARPLVVHKGRLITTREIAVGAGVAEGTLYRVFTDKDELIRAVVEKVFDETALDGAIRAIDPRLDFEERLAAAVDVLLGSLPDRRRLIAGMCAPQLGGSSAVSATLPSLDELVAEGRFAMGAEAAGRLLQALTVTLEWHYDAEPVCSRGVVRAFVHGAARD